jgi:hypothetical protein
MSSRSNSDHLGVTAQPRRGPLAPIGLPLVLLGYGMIGLGLYLSFQQSDAYRHAVEIPMPLIVFLQDFT